MPAAKIILKEASFRRYKMPLIRRMSKLITAIMYFFTEVD